MSWVPLMGKMGIFVVHVLVEACRETLRHIEYLLDVPPTHVHPTSQIVNRSGKIAIMKMGLTMIYHNLIMTNHWDAPQ